MIQGLLGVVCHTFTLSFIHLKQTSHLIYLHSNQIAKQENKRVLDPFFGHLSQAFAVESTHLQKTGSASTKQNTIEQHAY